MAKWTPTPIWKEKDVYILGGGRSMLNFDWSILKDKFVLGCNFSFRLGSEIVDANIMCDKALIKECHEELQKYQGVVYLNPPNVERQPSILNPSWAFTVPRERTGGLSYTGLRWNGNTGAAALNLSLIHASDRIFLLGFDMKAENPKNPDWYTEDYHDHKTRPATSARFLDWLEKFVAIRKQASIMFPNTQIINVNIDSDLDAFPTMTPEEHFQTQCFISK